MIREWFYYNIYRPVQKFYNYVTGKTEESSDIQFTSEGSADFSADPHHIPPSGDNDIL